MLTLIPPRPTGPLTAASLVRAVAAVIIRVAAPGEGHAAVVPAGELSRGAGAGGLGGAALFVAAVKAVTVAVAAPAHRHTLPAGTGEGGWGAGGVWNEGIELN